MKKEYSNGELTVVWEHRKCIHSKNCATGLPQVFDPNARPWVNMEGASSQEIADQVNKCPSGALTTYLNADGPPPEENDNAIDCEVMHNGPMLIKGTLKIHLPSGSVDAEGTTAFCRCGASENKPFCDGSHKKIGFEG